jgi:hypothetical protein
VRRSFLVGARVLSTIAFVVSVLMVGGARPAAAASGDPIADVTVPEPVSQFTSPSVAFDGRYLYYVDYGGSTLYRIDVPPAGSSGIGTGRVATAITGGPASGIMTLSYDAGRNAFWAVSGDGLSIYLLRNTGAATLAYTIAPDDRPGFTGTQPFANEIKIAYDGTDDTIWYSPDAMSRVYHYHTKADAGGTADLVAATPFVDVDVVPNDMSAECGYTQVSGVAVGGTHLFITVAGCRFYFEYTKTGTKVASYRYNFAGDFATPEDAECDNISYGVPVLWVREGYDGHIRAFELPSANACVYGGGASPPPGPWPTTHFTVTAAAGQTAGASFPFSVRAEDQFGNIDPTYTGTVRFKSSDSSSGVMLPPESALSGGQGTFSATVMQAGPQSITATDTTVAAITGQASVTVQAAAAARFVLSTSTTAPTAGASFSFNVTAQDQFGNTDTGYAGRVHFTSSDTSAGRVLPADSALTSGQGTFSATLTKAGPQTVTASDAAITGSLTVSVKAASATHFVLSTSTTAPTAGASFSFNVTAQDQFGNTDTGYAGRVHFTSSDTSAGRVLPADSALTSGQGTFSATLTKAGPQTVTAGDTGLSGSLTVSVRAAAAASLDVSAPASVTSGRDFTLSVRLTDRFGNIATGYAGTIHFTTTDPLRQPGDMPGDYTFTGSDAGTHDFTSVRLRTITLPLIGSPKQTITVTDGAGLQGTSTAITVNAL